MEIKVIDGDVNKAVKKLKRRLQQEGIFREIKKRRFYQKPSIRRRMKREEAERRLRKKLRRMRKG